MFLISKIKYFFCALGFFSIFLSSCLPSTQEEINEWFDKAASNCDINGPLHVCSRWSYLSAEEYEQSVMQLVGYMDHPITDGESIFDLGAGVAAPFKILEKRWPNLSFGGSDLAKNAIDIAKKVFPRFADRFFVHDMTQKHESVPDNSYDHVISLGALAMYLTEEGMQKAISEALRMTKPGGSLLITHFIEPGMSGRGSIITPILQKDLRNLFISI